MNAVFVNEAYILFLRDFGETQSHTHATCHLTISLNGKMACKINDEIRLCYGYILNANVAHERFGENANSIKLVFVFNPCTDFMLAIRNELVAHNGYIELTMQQYEEILAISSQIGDLTRIEWQQYLNENSQAFKRSINKILEISGVKKATKLHIDERVAYLINRLQIEETIENKIVDEVCEVVNLSKSRLLHLFKEYTGISLRKYMQYMKFFKTWHYIDEGENITQACIHAGYSDSAHYSNFMNQNYGLSTKQELNAITGVYLLE